MLRSFVQSRARPLRAKPAGRPSSSQATSSRCSSAGSEAAPRGGLPSLLAVALTVAAGAIRRRQVRCTSSAARLPAASPARCGCRTRDRLPDHPPVAEFLLGRALDDRADRDAGRAGARGGTGRPLRRGHLAATRGSDAGRASQPSARARCRCRAGRDAEARARPGGAGDGGAAQHGAPGSARRRPARWTQDQVTLLRDRCRSAGGGPHPGQPGHQAAALRGGARRPRLAAADTAVVRPRGAHAHQVPLPADQRECVQAPHRRRATAATPRCNGGSISSTRRPPSPDRRASRRRCRGLQGGHGGTLITVRR